MSLHNRVQHNIEYIQKLFLGVQDFMQGGPPPEKVLDFLDAEPPKFRSIAYESASMEIGLQDLSSGKALENWKSFYALSAKAHAYHMDIGLGWAFAKAEISPAPYLASPLPVTAWMVFDGMGYYHGLYRGRRAVKNQLIPADISAQELHGFDQGLGRRLWYISKGNAHELNQLIQRFPESRYADLWRGVGIACGYVGGCDKSDLVQLRNLSSGYIVQFCAGISLAAISRNASNSVTGDIELACEIICEKPFKDVALATPFLPDYHRP